MVKRITLRESHLPTAVGQEVPHFYTSLVPCEMAHSIESNPANQQIYGSIKANRDPKRINAVGKARWIFSISSTSSG